MQKSNAPTKLTVAFASGSGAGPVNTIPLTTNPTSGGASYQTGFTSVNMEPIASGGVPPYGADFNGLFQTQTKAQIWQQSGYMYPFDATFAGNANIGGYPAGSVLMMAGGKGFWLNQSDNNAVSPDTTGSTGWLGLAAAGTSTINTTGGTTTPDSSILGVTTLLVTGALTSNAVLMMPLTAGSHWIIANNTTGSFTLTVQGSSGAGVSITQGSALTVFTDGAAYYAASANISGQYLPINGTAVAATKLATARTIAMTGDVAWTSPAFDGTSNITATGTIQAGAVTLAKMANFQANSLMGNPTGSVATPSGITLGAGLQFSSSQLQLVPTSAQVVGWLGYTPVNKAGDTMTGNLTITGAALIQNTATANDRYHYIYTNGVTRWRFGGTGDTESGSNTGTNWALAAFNDSGSFLAATISIARSTSVVTFATRPVFGSAAPWDSANLTPLDRNLGGSITAPVTISGATANPLTLTSTNTSFTYLQVANTSTSGRSWAVGTTGSGNTIGTVGSFFIYDQTSGTPRMTIDASGNTSFFGTITNTGTVNFNTSDETLKDEIDRSAQPQPLHRIAPFATYRRTDTGQRGRGPIAQDLQRAQPLYVGEYQHPMPNGATATKLGIAQAAAALEEAWWCGRQVDDLLTRVAALEGR